MTLKIDFGNARMQEIHDAGVEIEETAQRLARLANQVLTTKVGDVSVDVSVDGAVGLESVAKEVVDRAQSLARSGRVVQDWMIRTARDLEAAG